MRQFQVLYILFALLLQLPSVSQETKKDSPGVFLNGLVGGVTLNTDGLLASIGAGLRWSRMHARMEFETIREDYVGRITQHKLFAAHLYNTHFLFGYHKSIGKLEGGIEAGPFLGWGTPGAIWEENFDHTDCTNCGGIVSKYLNKTVYNESWIYGGALNAVLNMEVSNSWSLSTSLGIRYYQFRWRGYGFKQKRPSSSYSRSEWRGVVKFGVIKKLNK